MAAAAEPDFYGPWPRLSHDGWRPRSPSSEILFQVVRDHFDEFLETVSLGSDGHGLPGHGLPRFVWPPALMEMRSYGA